MAESQRSWGKVRRLPSGRYQASDLHGGFHGVQLGTRYTAPQTFDAKGDAWAWLDREHRLVQRGEWSPPLDRLHQAAEERRREEVAREAAAAVPGLAPTGVAVRPGRGRAGSR